MNRQCDRVMKSARLSFRNRVLRQSCRRNYDENDMLKKQTHCEVCTVPSGQSKISGPMALCEVDTGVRGRRGAVVNMRSLGYENTLNVE
jgi:hypothetical protein